jgi:hypothetical protein
MIVTHPYGVRIIPKSAMRSIQRGVCIRPPMRGRALAMFILIFGSFLLPLVPTTSASLEELGDAGQVAEIDNSALGWWTLQNGNILVATSNGFVTAYSVQENGTYAEVWSVFTNSTLYSVSYNDVDLMIAVGTASGVIVVSIDYMAELYRFNVGEAVDALAWDRDGDLWVTKRVSKHAVEWDGTANAFSGISTDSSHNNAITDVVALSDGRIITTGRDKQIRVHDENGTFIQIIADSSFPLLRLGVSDDQSLLFSMTENCRLDIHNTSSWNRDQSLNLCSSGQGRVIQQLDQRLMLGMSNGKVFSIDLDTLTLDQEFTILGEIVGFRPANGSGVLILSAFSTNSEIHLLDADRDDDGVVDGLDTFPDDPNEDTDSDGDGIGDNADEYPNNPSEATDSDGDGVGDNSDVFPDNPSQQTDSDGDGWGDNKFGIDGDQFPSDSTQWADSDGDGYGDNQEEGATEPDACPNQNGQSTEDRLGCQDTDGDGYSDPGNGEEAHPVGVADAFKNDDSQQLDSDGDGYGDNLSGERGDACPTLAGYSTRANMYDPGVNGYTSINRYGCVDTDGDGYDDNTESTYGDCTMVGDGTEWLDADRDCAGSNGDYNDTDPEVQTLADHCEKHPDDFQTCNEPIVNDGNVTLLEEEEFDAMGAIKDFAKYGLIIVPIILGALLVIVGIQKTIGKVRDKRKPDAQYTHQDATRELDAWETGDKFETRGGIDEQKAWGDEPLGDGEEDSMAMGDQDEDIPQDEVSTEPDYVAEEMSVPTSSAVDAVEVDIDEGTTGESPDQGPQSTPEQPPDEAPPVPSGGLPEGWTMEQWRWYGHQWLERHGQQ